MANNTDSTDKISGNKAVDKDDEVPASTAEPLLSPITEPETDQDGSEPEKAEGPASEVVEFQDAAKSMDTITADAVPAEQMFMETEAAATAASPAPARGTGRGAGRRSSRFSNGGRPAARDIIVDGVLERAHRAHPTLRDQLRGTILLKVGSGREKYIVDWRTDSLKVAETKDETADCVIGLEDRDLEMIAGGNLNPQIAMLSEKISIEGDASLAMYFFNLIAPPSSH